MKELWNYSKDVYSQNGEDGINDAILKHLNIKSGVLLEIGAWDGFHISNTANLWSNNPKFHAILIENTERIKNDRLKLYNNVSAFQEFVSIDNTLESMINQCRLKVTNKNFVLASIDIDGDDLNVTKSLGKYKPIILIVESNGNVEVKTNPVGSTVLELVAMGTELGYELLGMSGRKPHQPGNVYFIRNDYAKYFPITEKKWQDRGIISY